jgi:hypothetical protein
MLARPRSSIGAGLHRARWALLMLLLVALFVPAATATAAQTPQPAGVNANAAQPLTDTGVQFWKWALKEPAPTNPLTDTTGQFCDRGQHGRTWFLGGIFSVSQAPVTRKCTVPAEKDLVFPVLNDIEGGLPGDPTTVAQWRAAAVAAVATATGMVVTVDGRKLPASDLKYEESRVFSLTLPANNIFAVPGPVLFDPIVDVGYYVHLRPLSPGKHTIHIQGSAFAGAFVLDVTYTLTIRRP